MTPSGFYMLAHTLEYIHTFMYTQREYKAHLAGLRYSWVTKCWLQGRVLVSKSLVLRGSSSSRGGGQLWRRILSCYNDRALLPADFLFAELCWYALLASTLFDWLLSLCHPAWYHRREARCFSMFRAIKHNQEFFRITRNFSLLHPTCKCPTKQSHEWKACLLSMPTMELYITHNGSILFACY